MTTIITRAASLLVVITTCTFVDHSTLIQFIQTNKAENIHVIMKHIKYGGMLVHGQLLDTYRPACQPICGLVHPYQLDEFISSFRDVWCACFILIYFVVSDCQFGISAVNYEDLLKSLEPITYMYRIANCTLMVNISEHLLRLLM